VCVVCVCVCVALGTKDALRMRQIVICGRPGSTIFFHIISKTAVFQPPPSLPKKKLLNIKHVFRVFLQLLSETFLILRRIERDTVENV